MPTSFSVGLHQLSKSGVAPFIKVVEAFLARRHPVSFVWRMLALTAGDVTDGSKGCRQPELPRLGQAKNPLLNPVVERQISFTPDRQLHSRTI
jgi:hypothetical protein